MSDLPLQGIRVIDLGHEWACPHTARFLADFGAQVIKIEYQKRLDFLRGGITMNRAYNRKVAFWQVHRNKQSLTLDLRDPLEKDLFEQLVSQSDIVLENSRPGVFDRLGLGYARLRELRPDIILVSMSAFGRTGPEAHYRGYGGTIEALAGIQSLTGYGPDQPARRIREMDVTNGIMGAAAALTALIARQRTGQGDWVDLSEMESASHALMGEHLMDYAVNGTHFVLRGNRHPEFAPQGCYPCFGENAWLVLTVQTDTEWRCLCQAINQPELATDSRLTSAEGRHEHHDEIDRNISEWSCSRTPMEATEILQASGIAAGPVLSMLELTKDEHLHQRDYYQHLESSPEEGRYLGFPLRLSRGNGRLLTRGPDLGAHNRDIVVGLLGLSEARIPTIDESKLGTSFEPI
ncbi:CoA transferase [Cyanobium sp. FGCU-52]|nr:CoA transferase [Cyanobium sp. FGCU52]